MTQRYPHFHKLLTSVSQNQFLLHLLNKKHQEKSVFCHSGAAELWRQRHALFQLSQSQPVNNDELIKLLYSLFCKSPQM